MYTSQTMSGKKSIYDTMVWILLIWCVFQDFFLSIFLKFTGSVMLTKLMFFGKDILFVGLFFVALFNKKIPHKLVKWFFIYYAIVIIHTVITIGFSHNKYDFTSILSSVRGLILLPTLTLIGFSIKDKQDFMKKIKKYYAFLIVIALIGLIEFFADIFVGTKSFWMDFLNLEDFYVSIKGQSAGLENGTPGNWYTDIGQGYRTQKRFISVWAAPLTAGFVMLIPCMYYTLKFFKEKKYFKRYISKAVFIDLSGFVLCAMALVLTFTRQTLLPYLVIAFVAFIIYRKENKHELIVGSMVFIAGIFVLMFDAIWDYIYNGSTMVHIMRIEESLAQIKFFGSGIASFGTRFAGSIATESQYITLIGQLGVLALIPYMILLLYPIVYCKRNLRYLEDDEKLIVCSICFSGLAYVLAGVVSETVAAFTSIAQYYVFIGFAWGYCRKNGVYKNEDKDYSDVPTTIP